ncbi:MAG: 2,3-bisphosphoglycerate-independent phosphoglycerate mutase, partial [Nitrospinota bacterium]
MLVLTILDGWGHSEKREGNALMDASTPFFDRLDKEEAKTIIDASGNEVGLLPGQMGNSEVGHLNIGAGRVVFQNLPRISNAISDGSFFEIKAFEKAMANAKEGNKALHLIGLLSDGGVHSHINHIFGLLEM